MLHDSANDASNEEADCAEETMSYNLRIVSVWQAIIIREGGGERSQIEYWQI